MVEPPSGRVGDRRARLGLVTPDNAVNNDECWQQFIGQRLPESERQ